MANLKDISTSNLFLLLLVLISSYLTGTLLIARHGIKVGTGMVVEALVAAAMPRNALHDASSDDSFFHCSASVVIRFPATIRFRRLSMSRSENAVTIIGLARFNLNCLCKSAKHQYQ